MDIFKDALDEVAPPPFNIICKVLGSKWTWIAAAVAAVLFVGHVFIDHVKSEQAANDAVKVQAAAFQKERNALAFMKQSRADEQLAAIMTISEQNKEILNAKKYDAQLKIKLANTSHRLSNANRMLRAALQSPAGRNISKEDIAAFRATAGPAVLGIQWLAVLRSIENQQAYKDFFQVNICYSRAAMKASGFNVGASK